MSLQGEFLLKLGDGFRRSAGVGKLSVLAGVAGVPGGCCICENST